MTTFHIETYGCSQNFSDSEQMAGLLRKAQFTPVENIEEADIVIINSCTVKSPTSNAFFTRLESIRKEYPYKIIIIAGCIPQTEPKKLKKYPLVGTRQIHNIVQVVEEALNNTIIKALERKEMPPLNMPRIRKNPLVEIIPISRGCLSACSFCITKQARGNLCSYSIEDIVHAALKAVTHGAKEIWLTAQDTTCYGFDIGTNLARLLRELVKIPGKFKIRVGMGSPKHLLKFKDELIPLFLEKKIFRFIHLPVQSGSDKVLQEMKRGNSKEEFISLIKELREAVPRLTVATDMIVGFPGESEEDFQETLELVKKVTPDVINISRFWPRPGTAAAKKKQVDVEVVKKRSSLLMDIFKNISRMQNELWIGWEGGILIDEKGKFEKQWSGRNLSYKPVIVEGDYKLGDVVRVKIEVAGVFDLRGKVVGSSH